VVSKFAQTITMDNKSIAKSFSLLAKLMELHGEDSFKIRSYNTAYNILRKYENPLADMSNAEIQTIGGLGKAIAGKIEELTSKGQMDTLDRFKDMTPPGIIEMLSVRGFGPKKVSAIWNQLGITTIGELLQACNENRLVALKGFGLKTQESLKQKLKYFQTSQGFFHFADAVKAIQQINEILDENLDGNAAIVGDAAKEDQVIKGITVLVIEDFEEQVQELLAPLADSEKDQLNVAGIDLHIDAVSQEEYAIEQLSRNSTEDYIEYLQDEFEYDPESYLDLLNEEAILNELDVDYLAPPQRELFDGKPEGLTEDQLITPQDIKGIVHSHSTYSDGLHSLKDMALYCKKQGFEYLLITDHSQSAFYADGLKPDRVKAQWAEIDQLNAEIDDFHIFKGIESDILNDGSLDYDEEMLKGFDVVIASIHSNLNMSEEKATGRLLTAVKNPHTKILGHLTGRLLLSREAYPIDHAAIIDACAEHNVVIELNSHPNRLDLDYHWIMYCREKGVKISINPDAHSKEAIHMVEHGVRVARKAYVTPAENISSLSREEFENYFK